MSAPGERLTYSEPEPQGLDLSKLGASDAAAIIGLSRFAGPWDVWARIVHGVGIEREPSEPAFWGSYLEDKVAARFISLHDPEGEWRRAESRVLDGWLRISLDFERPSDGAVLEIKTTSGHARSLWGAEWSGDVPDFVAAQVQLQLAALDRPQAYVAALFGGQRLVPFRVQRDAEMGDLLMSELRRFWDEYVLTESPPPVDDSSACRRWLTERHGSISTTIRDASPLEAEAAERLRDALRERDEADERAALFRNELLASIGGDRGIRAPVGKVLAPIIRGRKHTRWSDVRAELEPLVGAERLTEIIDRHTRTGESRRDVKGYWA